MGTREYGVKKTKMEIKCFLKHGLPFQNDPITGNLKRVNIMKLRLLIRGLGLAFSLRKMITRELLGLSEKEGWLEWKEESQKKKTL